MADTDEGVSEIGGFFTELGDKLHNNFMSQLNSMISADQENRRIKFGEEKWRKEFGLEKIIKMSELAMKKDKFDRDREVRNLLAFGRAA